MSPRSFRRAHARRIARAQRQTLLQRRRELTAGVIGAALLAPGAAHAADLTVLNMSDSGAGSLRAALTTANSNGEADVITFDPSVTGTIRLSGTALPISENNDLTITGPGRNVLTIDGDANNNGFDASDSRIFDVTAGTGPKIAISGLTLTHGFDPANGNGGAIVDSNDGTLALTDVAITDSKSGGNGGGIFANGALTVTDSTLSGNVAVRGGGFYGDSNGSNSGTATLTHTIVSSNQATSTGGGIEASGKYLTLANSTVTGNTATNGGGGIESFSKYGLNIKSSTLSGNSAPTGGGMQVGTTGVKYSEVRLTDSTVSGNQGTFGAGVYVNSVSSGSQMTFSRSTFSGNQGADNSFGGGMMVEGQVYGHFELLDSTVSGNTATVGGGISIGGNGGPQIGTYQDQSGSIDFDNSTIAGNTATAHGGGIYLSDYDSGGPPVKKSATSSITSTIVAGNTTAGVAQDLDRADDSTQGGFTGAFSLIQAPGDAPLTQQSMLIGVDPQLGALGDNGGPTKTMLPAGTSPVIDQGKSAAKVKVDQRGLDRAIDSGIANASPGGDGTDIGAVELAADQVVLPPPPPKATFDVTVRGKPISPGTPLMPASLLPFDCSVTVVSMTGCSIELRAIKSYKITKKSTVAKNTLLAEGVATSGPGTSKLSVRVKLTSDGKAVLKAQPVGVDTLVEAAAATGTTEALTQKGVVHLLAGPSVTLGLGKRKTKLPSTVNKRLDQLAKLIPDAKTVTCSAYSDKGTGDVTLTKKQAKAACARLVKDGLKATIKTSGKGHAKPVASNKTKKGRALNRRIVVTFTL